jgi:hypothetical protein
LTHFFKMTYCCPFFENLGKEDREYLEEFADTQWNFDTIRMINNSTHKQLELMSLFVAKVCRQFFCQRLMRRYLHNIQYLEAPEELAQLYRYKSKREILLQGFFQDVYMRYLRQYVRGREDTDSETESDSDGDWPMQPV